ncbi:MAG TPA: hypothetical protein VG123_06360 [Streptosporangiaceae bacterium]|jgi:hypothetical protein|nr:hypothetical protein [Streptosporangiaceae bacterium]
MRERRTIGTRGTSAGYSNGNARSHLLMYRRRTGEPKGFTWADYRDLIIAAHRRLSAP